MSQLSRSQKLLLIFLGGEIRFHTYPKWTLHFRRFSGTLLFFATLFTLISIFIGLPNTLQLRRALNQLFLVDGGLNALLAQPDFFLLPSSLVLLNLTLLFFLLAGLLISLGNLNKFYKRRLRILSITDVRIASLIPWKSI